MRVVAELQAVWHLRISRRNGSDRKNQKREDSGPEGAAAREETGEERRFHLGDFWHRCRRTVEAPASLIELQILSEYVFTQYFFMPNLRTEPNWAGPIQA
jgi:hypothetical protein